MSDLSLGEDPLLAASAVVEDERLAGTQGLVGQDDLELVAVLMRDEEVELDRLFVLLFDARPNVIRTLRKLEAVGFVRMKPVNRRKVPVTDVHTLRVRIDPFSMNDRLEIG